MSPWQRLEAWKAAHRLVLELYRATEAWSRAERYGLTGQVRRAAVSIPANIAEAMGLRGFTERARHLNIALGSFAELEYLLELALDLGVLSEQEHDRLAPHCAAAGRLLWGLYRRTRSLSAGK